MKRLTLLRHAKSSFDHGKGDFNRTLSERGQMDALLMGNICRENLPRPDLTLVSSARRTGETVDLFSRASGWDGSDRVDMDFLYLAGLVDWVNIITSYQERAEHILACAHQPGVELFARYLDHSFQKDVPTATVISLIFEGEFGSGMGKIDFYGKPEDYR